MEIKRGLIDRPNGWDAKPTTPYHMLGLAMVLTLWSVLGLAVVAFVRGDPEELSSRGHTFVLALITLIVALAWVFFLMHLRSLLLVRRITRGMAHKRFEDMQPGEVIATIEEHLARERIEYERLSLVGALPKEYVPGSTSTIVPLQFQIKLSKSACACPHAPQPCGPQSIIKYELAVSAPSLKQYRPVSMLREW